MSTKRHWVAALLLCVAGCGPTMTPAERLTNEAALKISQGNRTDAEAQLKQAIEKDPNLPWAHYNLATCLQARRAFKDAVAGFQRAADLFGQRDRHARSACLYGIAVTLDEQNEFGGALKAYEAYLAYAGPVPEDANGVAMARARMKILQEAVAKGIPAGKPLRAPITAAPAPAPTPEPPPPAAAAAPPPPPPVVAPAPEPVKAAPAKKGKRGKAKAKP
jgi:tetratricopeptide (TPR) repeat protein